MRGELGRSGDCLLFRLLCSTLGSTGNTLRGGSSVALSRSWGVSSRGLFSRGLFCFFGRSLFRCFSFLFLQRLAFGRQHVGLHHGTLVQGSLLGSQG